MDTIQGNVTGRKSEDHLRLIRFKQVAKDLQVHPRTLTRVVKAGRFPAPDRLNKLKVYTVEVAEQGKRELITIGLASSQGEVHA